MTDEHGLVARWKLVLASVRDRSLSAGDLAVLVTVLDCINEAGVAWPGLKKISDHANVDRSTAVRSVARLADRGYLVRESGNRTRSNRYSLGRCELAPRCESPPRCERAPRRNLAPEVGATLRLRVGANSRPDSAYKNLPNEPTHSSAPATRFLEFFDIYPKRVGKKESLAIWNRNKLDRHADTIVADVIASTAGRGWRGGEAKFAKDPVRYLRNEAWLDEWKSVATIAGRLARDTRTDDDIAAANEAQLRRMEAMG